MDSNEKWGYVEVSDEEKKSIGTYLGCWHTKINLLGDFTPENYKRLGSKGWSLAKTEEELKEYINDFVNIYSAMYKESKGNYIIAHLVRGTGNEIMNKQGNIVSHFISTSRNEGIAKKFADYGDGALVYFNLENGVPFLDVKEYRSEHGEDEEEIILAPFCKITNKNLIGKEGSYSRYIVNIEAPKLKEIPKEQIDSLYEEVVEGFSENMKNIRDCIKLADKYEWINEMLKRTTNREDIYYLEEEKEYVYEQYERVKKSTSDFKEKLQTLLMGLCKQKELEIDKSIETLAEKRRIEEEERIANERETRRKGLITEVATKLKENPSKTIALERNVIETYQKLLESEKIYCGISGKLGISHTKLVSMTEIRQRVEEIQNNLKYIESKTENVEIDENTSLEEILKVIKEVEPLLDGVSCGLEMIGSGPDVVQMYKMQSEKELKRNLYLKVQSTIKGSKVQKYTREKEKLKQEKIGLWGKLTGKNKLQEEKIENTELKIVCAQSEIPEEKQEYRVREMLADLYGCVLTEFEGDFKQNPDIDKLYAEIKSVFRIKGKGEFSDEYIKRLAIEKIEAQKRQLPAITERKAGITMFSKRKAQRESLQAEKYKLQQKIQNNNRYNRNRWGHQQPEADALTMFQNKLKGISSTTSEMTKTRDAKDMDKTFG